MGTLLKYWLGGSIFYQSSSLHLGIFQNQQESTTWLKGEHQSWIHNHETSMTATKRILMQLRKSYKTSFGKYNMHRNRHYTTKSGREGAKVMGLDFNSEEFEENMLKGAAKFGQEAIKLVP